MMKEITCHSCKKTAPYPISRKDSCANCHSDLRCCLNCSHYDSTKQYSCQEHISENINDKEKANFCDYFKGALRSKSSNQGELSPQEELLKKAEALFKKKN